MIIRSVLLFVCPLPVHNYSYALILEAVASSLCYSFEAQGHDKINKGVVWPPCLAILCYMSGGVGHVCACVKGSVSLGEGVVG